MNCHVHSQPQFLPQSLAPSRFSDHIHQMIEDFLEEVAFRLGFGGWVRSGEQRRQREGLLRRGTTRGVCFMT